MVSQSKRKIFKMGPTSKGITLPKDWVDELENDEVHLIYDNCLVIFKEKPDCESFVEKIIANAIVSNKKE